MAHKNLLNQNYDQGEPEPVWPTDKLQKNNYKLTFILSGYHILLSKHTS